MRTTNQSLLGFLKKKTLFGQSPLKNLPPRDSPLKNKTLIHDQTNQKIFNNSKSSKYLHSYNQDQDYDDRKSYITSKSGYPFKSSRFINNRSHYQQYEQAPRTLQKNYSSKSPIKLNSSIETSKQSEQSQMWAALVNYSSTFQSSRIQSARCIDQMSEKLTTQFQIINHKIQNFHNQLVQAITRQLFQAKQKILQTVIKIFQESQLNLKQYIKREQEKVAHELYRVKQLLQKQYKKVQVMKQGIKKSAWKKTAGQLISSQLEKRVESLLKESQSIGNIKWQLTSLGRSKLSSLQNQIRNIIRIQVNEIK